MLSGVTLIAHGAQGFGDDPQLPAWVAGMATQIATRIGETHGGLAKDVAQFKMTIEEVDDVVQVTGWDFTGSFTPAAEDTAAAYDLADSLGGQAIISLDWSAVAAPLEMITQTVAATASTYLFSNLSSLGNDLLASSIHLIGHSRGASLVGALAEDLGNAGVWVDQVTYLDTHPLEFIVDPDDWGDNGFSVTENVVFGDSYWREDLDPLDFDGETVPGAYNAKLNEEVLDAGLGYSSAHSNVHLWYHGTIDTTEGINDGEVELTEANLATWYDSSHEMAGPRAETGYYYSRTGGGTRPSSGIAASLGGEGVRSNLVWTNAVWPNILGLKTASDRRHFSPGDTLNVEFHHQDYDSQSSAGFYLDPDQNPYNDNAILISDPAGQTLAKTDATPVAQVGTGDLTGIALGDYYLLGTISDETGHTRYAYAASPITVGTPVPVITDLEADPASINEGGTTTLSCGFTDASLVDVHTVTINWGDGNSETFDLTEGERGFARPHKYLDEYSAGMTGDPYTVTVTISDQDGGTDSQHTSIAVANVAPAVGTVSAVLVDEGDQFTSDVAFTDPGADQWTADVDYGDGSGWQSATVDGKTVKLDHHFGTVGTHTVSVRVRDDLGAEDTDTFTVTVQNVAPSLWVRGLRVVDEGAELSVANLGIFTDPGFHDAGLDVTDFTYTIDWADGSTPDSGNAEILVSGSSGKLTWGTFDGAHTYQADGRYSVAVTVADEVGGTSIERFMTVVVNNVAPRTLQVDDIAAITEGDIAYVHGTFSDGGILDQHTVTVSWGDGTADSVLVLPAGQTEFTIPVTPSSDPHRYADDGPNSSGTPSETYVYTVRVTVADADGGSISVDKTVQVNNAAPQVTPIAAQEIGEGSLFSQVLASFADAGSTDVHTALIDWGDGTPAEAGVVDATARTIAAAHIYAEQREDDTGNVIPYTVTVTVTDDDGGSATGTFEVTVTNAAPSLGTVPDAAANEGGLFTLGPVSFVDAGTTDTHTVLIDWGDGTEAEAGTINAVARTITGSHVYADENEDKTGNVIPYTVTIKVTDDDDAVGIGTVAVAVANVAPVLAEMTAATVNKGEVFSLGPVSFVDKGTLDTHTAVIDWGDGNQGPATVVESPTGPPGSIGGLAGTITATHTYTSERVDGEGNVIPYEVTVTLTDDDGASHARTFSLTVEAAAAMSSVAAAEAPSARVFVGPLPAEEYQALFPAPTASTNAVVGRSMVKSTGSGRAFVGPLEADAYLAATVALAQAEAENEPPILAVIGSVSIPEGTVDFGQIATFIDIDSEGPFVYKIDWGDDSTNTTGNADVENVGPPAVGSIAASHDYGDDGSYTVSVTLSDEDGMSTTEVFTVSVTNAAPVADANGPYQVEESGSVQLAGSATDAAGDQSTLVYEWDLDGDGIFGETGDTAAQGDENVQNPVFSAEGINGPATWTVFLRSTDDGGATSTVSQAAIEIGNAAPIVAADNASVTVTEGTTAENTGTYSDPGGDSITLSASAGTILNNGDGTWSWSSATTDGPDDSKVVTITATDSDGLASTATFELVVENAAPAVNVDQGSVTVSEGQTAAVTGSYSDLGVDTVTLAASIGTIVDKGNGVWNWSYAATDGPSQTQVVTITATDGDGGSGAATFNLVVENVAPTATVNSDAVSVNEGELAGNSGTYQDPGDDTLAFTASVGTVVDNGNGTWNWSLQAADGPDDSAIVTVTISDKDGGAAEVTFELAVANVAPTVEVDLAEVDVVEGQTATNTGSYVEPGSDAVSLAASIGMIVDHGDGTWTWSFSAADGPDESQTVTITATDSDGAATTATFSLVVANAPPVANDDYYVFDGIGTLEIDAARGVLANDSDPGGDEIAVDSWGEPSIGELSEANSDGSFVYVGPDGYSGTVTFNYTVRDEDGALSERQAIVKIDVGTNSGVTGSVYAKNSDSRFQPAALPLPGVVVTLTAIDDTDLRGEVEINTLTDNNGQYTFEGLRAGDYQIVVRQPAACFAGSSLTATVTLGANDEAEVSPMYTGWLRPTSISIGSFLGSTIRTSSTTYGWSVGLREQMAKAEERAGNAELAASIRLGEVVQIARRGSLVTITGTSLDEAFQMYSDSEGYHVSLGGWSTVYSAGSVSQVLVESGGGNDTAVLHDSALDDILAGQSNSLTLTNDELVWELRDFSSIKAIADAGGTDTKAATSNIDFVLEISGDWD